MQALIWRNSFNTGVELFDEEHHKIVELMNTTLAVILNNGGCEAHAKICEDLLDYMEYHFSHEEKAMALVNYPAIEEHIADHKWLKQEVEKHQRNINNDCLDALKGMYLFLYQWLIDHIQIVDKQYGSYLINVDEADII